MTDDEGRLILGKWIEEAAALLIFVVVPPVGLSLRANGILRSIDSNQIAILENADMQCRFGLMGARFEYADSRDTLELPYTGKPLHLVDAISALKIALPHKVTVILIEPKAVTD